MKLHGMEGMSSETLRDEINRGGRLVVYTYCVSFFVLTLKRPTDVRLIRAGHSPVSTGLPYVFVSLLFGWWGIPWGPIYTIEAIYRNLGGGIDVTNDVLRQLMPATSAASVAPAPSLTVAPPVPARKFNLKTAGFMAFAAVALIVGGLAIYCYQQAQHLTVALVSGLDQPYAVKLNGTEYRLGPHASKVVTLPEGEFTLEDAPGNHVVGETRKFQLATPFFSHLDTEMVAVINPDRAAVLFNEEVLYYSDGTTPPANEEPAYTVLAAEQTYFFAKPDYVIETPPERTSMPSGTARTVKTRLELARETSLQGVAQILGKKAGYGTMREHLMILAHHRADEALLATALINLQPADLPAFFQIRLGERPVLVEWHRYYQQEMQTSQPDRDLAAEYRGYLRKEPTDGALMYLLGRVTDEDESQQLWQRALAATPPCPQALAALGYDDMCEARFAEALEKFSTAEKAGATGPGRAYYRRMAYLALGQYDPLLAEIRTDRKSTPFDLELAGEEIRVVLAASRDAGAARKLKADFLASLRAARATSEFEADANAYLQAAIDYQSGDLADYASQVSHFDAAFYKIRAAVTSGQIQPAAKAILGQPHPRSSEILLLYLLAKRSGDDAQADQFFAQSLEIMKKEAPEYRKTAQLLTASKLDANRLCQLRVEAGEKCILLTALSLRDPANRPAYLAMAAKLDFNPDFPHQFVHSFLAPADKS
jgi:hypothetical protein